MEDIIIKKTPNKNTFEVFQGNKRSDILGYDECMGLVATIIIENSCKGCLGWMMTDEEHLQQRAYFANINKRIPQREPMLQLPPHIDYGEEALDRFVITLEKLKD